MKSTLTILLCVAACTASLAHAQEIVVGLITKTETNPFFVKMKEGATEAAKAKGAKLMTAAGKFDGDNASQVTAIENMVAAGAKAILITPSDTKAIVPAIKKARDAGVLVIALDTPTDPQNATDALFATDNFKAGVLIGQYAKAAMAGKTGQDRHARPRARHHRRQAAPRRLPAGLRHQGRRSEHRVQPGHAGRSGQGADGDGELPAAERPTSTSSTRSTSRPPPEPIRRSRRQGRRKHVLIVSVDGGCAGVQERQGGHHRRHVAAVPAEDGVAWRRGRRRVRQDRQEGSRLHRYRRDAHHRQADVWRRQQGHHVRHGCVLGREVARACVTCSRACRRLRRSAHSSRCWSLAHSSRRRPIAS